MKFKEIDISPGGVLEKCPIEIQVIFQFDYHEGDLLKRYQLLSDEEYRSFAYYGDYWDFVEAWKRYLVLGEDGNLIKNIYPYYEAYSKGFNEGYFEFENEVKESKSIFQDSESLTDKIFKETLTKEFSFSARGYFYPNDDSKKKPIPVLKKDFLFEGGKKAGRAYKAWYFILHNYRPFIPIFREFYLQHYKFIEENFRKWNSHMPGYKSHLQNVIDEIESSLPLQSKIQESQKQFLTKKIELINPKSINIDQKIFNTLFDGLKDFFKEKEFELKTLLSGEEINERLIWSLNQNQFTDVFYRLKSKKYISQNYTKITEWICKNFVLMNGVEFNKVSVYDSIRGHTKTAKANRILNNLFD